MAHPDGLELLNGRGGERDYVHPKQVDGHYAIEDLWVMQGSVCDQALLYGLVALE